MRRFLALVGLLVATRSDALLLPAFAGAGSSGAVSGIDVLQCATIVAPVSMTATKLAGYRATGAGTLGVALYPDADGGTQLGEAIAPTGHPTATGLSISIVVGTRYRICACGSATTVNYLSLHQAAGTPGRIGEMLNAGAFPTSVGTGANACVAGDPPATTGAITANITFKLPLLLLE